MVSAQADVLVLNPDELGQDPTVGMDLAVQLGVTQVEIRTAYGSNALLLRDEQLRTISTEARGRGLAVAALASPLFKWCDPRARPSRVDSFGFPTQVPAGERARYVERALEVADILDTRLVRIFSNLRVAPDLTEPLAQDRLLPVALEQARRAGVTLLIENEPVCTTAAAGPLLSLLRTYGDQGLRLWLDLANLHQLGDGRPESIEALAGYVEYVHVKDYRHTSGGRAFCAAGTGEVPYDTLLPLLASRRPALPYALETHVRDVPATALIEGADYLRRTLSMGGRR